jgi:hypothetical protein
MAPKKNISDKNNNNLQKANKALEEKRLAAVATCNLLLLY